MSAQDPINVPRHESNYGDLEQYLLQEWGRDGRVGYGILTDLIDLGIAHGKEQLYAAIKTAARANVKSYRYVLGILLKVKSTAHAAEVKELGFVEIVCSCAVSTIMRKVDLVQNKERMWTCTHCHRSYSVKLMLEKESRGRIILMGKSEWKTA